MSISDAEEYIRLIHGFQTLNVLANNFLQFERFVAIRDPVYLFLSLQNTRASYDETLGYADWILINYGLCFPVHESLARSYHHRYIKSINCICH